MATCLQNISLCFGRCWLSEEKMFVNLPPGTVCRAYLELRPADSSPPAPRAAAWRRDAFAVGEHKSAMLTNRRFHQELFPLCSQALSNMLKMHINLFFTLMQRLRELSRSADFSLKQCDQSSSNGIRGRLVFHRKLTMVLERGCFVIRSYPHQDRGQNHK